MRAGEKYPPRAELGQLSEEPFESARPRRGENKVEPWRGRLFGMGKPQFNSPIRRNGDNFAQTRLAVDYAGFQAFPRRCLEHIADMQRAEIVE